MAVVSELELVVQAVGAEQTEAALARVQQAEQGVVARSQALANAQRSAASGSKAMQVALQREASAANAAASALQRKQRMSVMAALKSRQLGTSVGMAVNEISELGFALSTVIPGFRQTGMFMAMAGNSAFQLGSRMGLVGVAIGGLLGMLPAIVQFFQKTDKEAKKTKKTMDELQKSIAAVTAEWKKQALMSRLQMGVASQAEHLGRARQLEEQRVQMLRQLADDVGLSESDLQKLVAASIQGWDQLSAAARSTLSVWDSVTGSAEEKMRKIMSTFRKAGQMLEEAQRQRQFAREVRQMEDESKLEEFYAEEEKKRRGTGRRAARRRAAGGGSDRSLESLMQQAIARGSRTDPVIEQIIAEGERRQQAELAVEERRQRALAEAERRGMQERERRYRDSLERMQQLNERYVGYAAQAGEALSEAFVGGKNIPEAMGKVVADAIGREARIQSAKEVALAASSFALGNVPGGLAHSAAAVAWAGIPPLASALFGIGSSGGGEGASSGGGKTAPPAMRKARSEQAGRGQESKQVVVNINAPTPEALIGRYNRRAERAYARRYGRRS